MKSSDYIAPRATVEEYSAVARHRESWEMFALWWMVTFDESVELETGVIIEIQKVWESFGPVSVHDDPEGYVERLQATASAANYHLGGGAWEEICHMGIECTEAHDYDARMAWIADLRDIETVSNSRMKEKRRTALSERIRKHFCRS